MAFLEDLSPWTYVSSTAGDSLLAVGWLEQGKSFPTGPIVVDVFKRLEALCTEPWQPFAACGVHECTLCQFNAASGSDNVFIPGAGVIYVCPELIVHYIGTHWYLPPEEFCEAVRRCPDQRTMEYKRLLLQNGGRNLIRPPQGPTDNIEIMGD
jgi:hypothetical protein